ncbi:hypothetical protein RIF29_20816 [Crotalaria pallida]|uniref:Uncharacterized protein n=1 Tax=Crotalaria pallida TaxID=3830 RepID=A0AAN9F3M8_CROPI
MDALGDKIQASAYGSCLPFFTRYMHENIVYDFCAFDIKANDLELRITDHRLRLKFLFYTCFKVVDDCNFPLNVLSLSSFGDLLVGLPPPPTVITGRAVFHTLNHLTKILINPNIAEVHRFEQRMLHRGLSQTPFMVSVSTGKTSLDDDLMGDSPFINLQTLKSIEKPGIYKVEASIVCISEKNEWFYNECSCKGLLVEKGDNNLCVFYNETNGLSYPRYSIPIVVMDSSSTATLIMLDRQAMFMLSTRCSDLFSLPKAAADCFKPPFPNEYIAYPNIFKQLIGGNYIFKVELSRYKGASKLTIFRMFPKKMVGMQILSNDFFHETEKVNSSPYVRLKNKHVHGSSGHGFVDYRSRKRSGAFNDLILEGQSSGLKKLAIAAEFVESKIHSEVSSAPLLSPIPFPNPDVFPSFSRGSHPNALSSTYINGLGCQK